MSMGFINPGVMPLRGAKITPIVQQLVGRTVWGELDVLIVDMRPGTGDVQLTLSQDFRVTAAVLVTTPQRLSFVDVVKGIEMFDKVGIPTVAVMENMSELNMERLCEQTEAIIAKLCRGAPNAGMPPSAAMAVTRPAVTVHHGVRRRMRPPRLDPAPTPRGRRSDAADRARGWRCHVGAAYLVSRGPHPQLPTGSARSVDGNDIDCARRSGRWCHGIDPDTRTC